jgi:hypothetical protein
MKIISASERLREASGVKALIVGPPKVGKTSLLRTVDAECTLFIDLEAGDLALKDVPVDTLRPRTWQECRDLACFLTGANPSLAPTASYSEAHFEAVRSSFEGMSLDKYTTYFVDSITVAARLCFRWCEQQPESFSERSGKKDVRGCFGLLGREMIGWLTQLQHARGKNVIFVAVLERITDEFKRGEWSIQIEGQKTGRELPAIVDEILTLGFVDFADGQPPTRCFVCGPNEWGFPAGDRSGRLAKLEQPHLGKLLAKLTKPQAFNQQEKEKVDV